MVAIFCPPRLLAAIINSAALLTRQKRAPRDIEAATRQLELAMLVDGMLCMPPPPERGAGDDLPRGAARKSAVPTGWVCQSRRPRWKNQQ